MLVPKSMDRRFSEFGNPPHVLQPAARKPTQRLLNYFHRLEPAPRDFLSIAIRSFDANRDDAGFCFPWKVFELQGNCDVLHGGVLCLY